MVVFFGRDGDDPSLLIAIDLHRSGGEDISLEEEQFRYRDVDIEELVREAAETIDVIDELVTGLENRPDTEDSLVAFESPALIEAALYAVALEDLAEVREF